MNEQSFRRFIHVVPYRLASHHPGVQSCSRGDQEGPYSTPVVASSASSFGL